MFADGFDVGRVAGPVDVAPATEVEPGPLAYSAPDCWIGSASAKAASLGASSNTARNWAYGG
jgi:hypothetical protein